MESVTVIIPNLDGEKLLSICLDSVFKQTFKNFKVVVVDNGSNDNSIQLITTKYPQVDVIALSKNLGFAKAVNLAARKANSEFIAFLNNDAKVSPNWLKYLTQSLKKDSNLAAAAPKVLNYSNPSLIDNASDTINIVGQASPVGHKMEDQPLYNKPKYVFGVSGAASLFRKKILVRLNFFDEHFFFYFEDVDFSLRAQLAGYKFFYNPRAVVYHYGQRTVVRFAGKVEYWRFRNTIMLVVKNFPFQLFPLRGRWFKIPLVWIHTWYFFFKNGLQLEAIMTLAYIVINLPKLIHERYTVQKTRKVTIEYMDNLMEDKSLKILWWRI